MWRYGIQKRWDFVTQVIQIKDNADWILEDIKHITKQVVSEILDNRHQQRKDLSDSDNIFNPHSDTLNYFTPQEKKEEIWLSPMTEAPTPTEKSKKHRDNTKNATKNFDRTTIADRLRTVRWTNSSHPTGMVKTINERSTFPLTRTAV